MKLNALVSAVVVAFAGNALAQTSLQAPAQDGVKGAVKADRGAVKMDKAAVKSDKAALKMDRGEIKSDFDYKNKAGHKVAPGADKSALKVDQAKTKPDVNSLKAPTKQAIQK